MKKKRNGRKNKGHKANSVSEEKHNKNTELELIKRILR